MGFFFSWLSFLLFALDTRCAPRVTGRAPPSAVTWRRAGGRITTTAPSRTKPRSRRTPRRGFTCKSLYFFLLHRFCRFPLFFFFFSNKCQWTGFLPAHPLLKRRVYCRKHRDASQDDVQGKPLKSPFFYILQFLRPSLEEACLVFETFWCNICADWQVHLEFFLRMKNIPLESRHSLQHKSHWTNSDIQQTCLSLSHWKCTKMCRWLLTTWATVGGY